MLCASCGSDKVLVFFEEKIICSHCNTVNILSYNLCTACGLVWHSIGDEPLEGTMVISPMLREIIKKDINVEDLIVSVDSNNVKGTMEEVVHKCIRCNSVAFEVAPGYYHCPKCNFEWEVI